LQMFADYKATRRRAFLPNRHESFRNPHTRCQCNNPQQEKICPQQPDLGTN
jgi:hypothetical protein